MLTHMHRLALQLLTALLLLLNPQLTTNSHAALWPFGVDSCMYNANAVDKLKLLLHNNVVGQDSAMENIIALTQQHIDQILMRQQYSAADAGYTYNVPTKPLVLSLHGLPGTGKSLTSTYIVDALLTNGMKSTHILKFHGKDYSSPAIYRHIHHIQSLLTQAIQRCDLSIFIFEEIHYMADGVLEGLISYMEYDSMHIDDSGAKFTFGNTIWLFTSNYGGQALQKLAYDAERRGMKREDIPYESVRNAIHLALKTASTQADLPMKPPPGNGTQPTVGPSSLRQHTRNASADSTQPVLTNATQPNAESVSRPTRPRNPLQLLVDHSVISRFVPFFPLFKTHVKKCASLQLQQRAAYLQSQGQLSRLTYDESVLSLVANRMSFIGPISESGCKNIDNILVVDVFPAINKLIKLEEPVASAPKIQRIDAATASHFFSYLKERVLPSTIYTTRTSEIHLSTKQLQIGHGSNADVKEIVVSEVLELKVDNDSSASRKTVRRGKQDL